MANAEEMMGQVEEARPISENQKGNKPIFELKDICKSFGMTHALTDMSLKFYTGEVHAIVGENGAGKSTIIKIMTGIYSQDKGAIDIDGVTHHLRNVTDARKHGISAIYQEPMVFPDLNVAENIFINAKSHSIWLKTKDLYQQAQALIDKIGIKLDVKRLANGLTLAEQQAVEIARALSQDVRILIMDEPTASLSAYEAQQLRNIAQKLAKQNVAVIYISHRLEEIFDIADKVTVIRDGTHISTRKVKDASTDGIISDMVGRAVGNYLNKTASTASNEAMFAVDKLTLTGVFHDISFTLHKGEVLCFAGLVGARRTDVALALFGIAPPSSGKVVFEGRQVNFQKPRQAMDAGIAYVSEDRRKLGLAMKASISHNTSLTMLDRFLSKLGLINIIQENATAEFFRKKLNIRTKNTDLPVEMLSGGNQQKVMLAKWLNMEPKLLIFDEPTRGIDVGAKAEMHGIIRDFVKTGGAALVISSDLPEVLALADNVLVMREGNQMGILPAKNLTQEKIMALATGSEHTTKKQEKQ